MNEQLKFYFFLKIIYKKKLTKFYTFIIISIFSLWKKHLLSLPKPNKI